MTFLIAMSAASSIGAWFRYRRTQVHVSRVIVKDPDRWLVDFHKQLPKQ